MGSSHEYQNSVAIRK